MFFMKRAVDRWKTTGESKEFLIVLYVLPLRKKVTIYHHRRLGETQEGQYMSLGYSQG